MSRTPFRKPLTVRLAASFRDDYHLLDSEDRRGVDRLLQRLEGRIEKGGEFGAPILALDEYRLMRSLRVTDDAILTVTDGRVALDVLCRSQSAEVIVLGAAGRATVLPLGADPAHALAG